MVEKVKVQEVSTEGVVNGLKTIGYLIEHIYYTSYVQLNYYIIINNFIILLTVLWT